VVREIDRIASFIPKKDRLKIFQELFREYNKNARIMSETLSINIRRIYFYIPDGHGKPRNYPNDQTMSSILKAFLKKNPEKTMSFLKEFSIEFERLYKDIVALAVQ